MSIEVVPHSALCVCSWTFISRCFSKLIHVSIQRKLCVQMCVITVCIFPLSYPLYMFRHCVIFPGRGRTTSQTCRRWFDSLQEGSFPPCLLSKQMSVFLNYGGRPSPSPLAFFGVADAPSDRVRLHLRVFPPNTAMESLSCCFGLRYVSSCHFDFLQK